MAFDFSKLIADEQKKQEEQTNKSGGIGFKTVYPFNNGRLEFKFIGNEPSGLLYREVTFHQYYAAVYCVQNDGNGRCLPPPHVFRKAPPHFSGAALSFLRRSRAPVCQQYS